MADRVIYEKKYSDLLKEEDNRIMSEMASFPAATSEKQSAEYFKKLFENTVLVLIPERIEGREVFIDAAKEMGDLYQLDTVIKEHEDRISDTYAVDCCVNFRGLKKIIMLADDLSLDYGDNVVFLTLYYYTHATYRSGRKITPPHDLCFGAEFPRMEITYLSKTRRKTQRIYGGISSER